MVDDSVDGGFSVYSLKFLEKNFQRKSINLVFSMKNSVYRTIRAVLVLGFDSE